MHVPRTCTCAAHNTRGVPGARGVREQTTPTTSGRSLGFTLHPIKTSRQSLVWQWRQKIPSAKLIRAFRVVSIVRNSKSIPHTMCVTRR